MQNLHAYLFGTDMLFSFISFWCTVHAFQHKKIQSSGRGIPLNIVLRMDPLNRKVGTFSTNSVAPGIESRRHPSQPVDLPVRNMLYLYYRYMVRNHLQGEAWPSSLEMSPRVAARVFLGRRPGGQTGPRPPRQSDRQPLAQPPPLGFPGGCPYIYVATPRQYII
jgi:hypothetical protein